MPQLLRAVQTKQLHKVSDIIGTKKSQFIKGGGGGKKRERAHWRVNPKNQHL